MNTIDPLKFAKWLWPGVSFYDKQREIIYSVRDNDRTIVPAGNMLGKDFVAAYIALWFFLCHHPVRIITTSVKDEHLDVLWGEIDRFIRTAKYPLTEDKGGSLVYNHHEIRKIVGGELDKYSYLKGQVSKKGEGMSGHHARHTLLIVDEASGVEDVVYEMAQAWAKKMLILGNTNPCENFFRRAVREGDKPAGGNGHLYQKGIKIKGDDSPNVRYARAELAAGRKPSNRILVPGVLSWPEYCQRREILDPVRQSISLDAEFYEGAEILLFPPDWLNRAEQRARDLQGRRRQAKTIGVDPAEGGDKTAWAVCDELGLMHLVSFATPDTTVIPDRTLAMMREYNVPAEGVVFDAGGGGKEHADRLRSKGHNVRTVAFGEAATPPRQRRVRTTFGEKVERDETRYAYRNRRAEMYGILRLRLDSDDGDVFALPAEYSELRKQLAVFPLLYDEEGRMILPPKNKRNAKDTRKTLTELVGHSPDEADALVLAVYGMFKQATELVLGVRF